MGTHERKVKKELAFDEIGAFLRSLADAYEGRQNELGLDTGEDLQGFDKFEIKMKRNAGNVALKLKIAREETESERSKGAPEESGSAEKKRPNYKELKKQLQQSYKTIKKCVSENMLPEQPVVQSFVRDSLIMVSFPGYGDEYYEAYVQACNRFLAGFENKNFAAVRDSLNEIGKLKNDCHDRYK